jgi:hypothetical protein
MGRLRRRLAADQLADLVALDKKLAAVEAEIRAMVKRTPTGLPDVYGIGPVITATIIGEVGDVARFRDRHHFASYNGTAPDDKGSAGRPVHCVNLKGNPAIEPCDPHGGDHPDPQPSQSRPRLLRTQARRGQDQQGSVALPHEAHLRCRLPPTPRRR